MVCFELAIIKVAAICNINCSYCYMFNANDKTFEFVPKFMSEKTSEIILERVNEYLSANGKNKFHLTLHGGEPALWPKLALKNFLNLIKRNNSFERKITVSMQTNGFRYDRALYEILAENDVSIGVSLDGPKAYNDKRRVTHNGHGSYTQVINTVEKILASDAANILHGFLAVADPSLPPAEFVNWVGSLPITKIDVLWPMNYFHGNVPWSMKSQVAYRAKPIYGQWFSEVFDIWMEHDNPDIFIRHFFDCIEHYLGASRHIESIVNDKVPMFVVNTDGQYEYHDYIRPHGDGKCRTMFNVETDPIANLHNDAVFKQLLTLSMHLPVECESCDVRAICGGGFLPGRVGQSETFTRSILCHDQNYFFGHVRNKLKKMGILPAPGRAVFAKNKLKPLFAELN